jgi:YD repeat-containing protein
MIFVLAGPASADPVDSGNYGFDTQTITATSSVAVNVATGDLLVRQQESDLSGTFGTDLTFGQVYNSLSDSAGNLGSVGVHGGAWNLAAAPDIRLVISSSGVVLHDGSGAVSAIATGAGVGDDQYIEPVALGAQLTTAPDGTFTLAYDATASRLTFDSTGKLTMEQDGEGRQISYGYLASGDLVTIQHSDGRYFGVGNSSGHISVIGQTNAAGAQIPGFLVNYGYDSFLRLHTVTDATGVTTYGYDTQSLLSTIDAPDGTHIAVTYAAGKVATVTKTTGVTSITRTYTYGDHKTTVAPSTGSSVVYYYDASGQLYSPDTAPPTAQLRSAQTVYSDGINSVSFDVAMTDDRSGVQNLKSYDSLHPGTVSSTFVQTGCAYQTQIPGWDAGSGTNYSCPRTSQTTLSIPTTGLTNGPHAFNLVAQDGAGNTTTLPVTIVVDSTPPPAPSNLQAYYDADAGGAALYWQSGDPDGPSTDQFRFSVNGGAFTDWFAVAQDQDQFADGVSPSSTLLLEVRTIDRAGRLSTVTSATVPVIDPDEDDAAARANSTRPAWNDSKCYRSAAKFSFPVTGADRIMTSNGYNTPDCRATGTGSTAAEDAVPHAETAYGRAFDSNLLLKQNPTQANRRKWPVTNSLGQTFAWIEQSRPQSPDKTKDVFSIYNAAGSVIVASKTSPGGLTPIDLRIQGRACMINDSLEGSHVEVALYAADYGYGPHAFQNPAADAGPVNMNLRGFLADSDFPSTAGRNGTEYAGLSVASIANHYDVGCTEDQAGGLNKPATPESSSGTTLNPVFQAIRHLHRPAAHQRRRQSPEQLQRIPRS